VPGPRADPLSAGILLGGAHLRRLRRHRVGDQRSLHDCRGETRAYQAEIKLNVKVPPGVEEGTRIRYAGEGDAGRAGGPKGDLYVVLSVRPHDFFERHGYDLHCVIPISFPQAALGAEFEIPGIDGPVNLKIPEGTQSGRELRVRGRGVPYLNEKGHGDLIVKVLVQIPGS
jgi:molecular chaperone DnaJ